MNEFIFLDSSVLISLKERRSVFYDKSIEITENILRTDSFGIINSYVLNEVHYFYSKNSNKQNASKVIKSIFDIPNLKYQDIIFEKEDLFKIMKLCEKYNLKTFDAYHVYYCKKLGIKKIATFDDDFKKIKWLKVVN